MTTRVRTQLSGAVTASREAAVSEIREARRALNAAGR